jgi:hypothetical protein
MTCLLCSSVWLVSYQLGKLTLSHPISSLSVFLKQILFVAICSVISAPSFGVDASSAPQDLLQKAKTSGLISEGPSVATFTWQLDVKKPLKSARRQVETFSGAVSQQQPGLSMVKRARHEGATQDSPAKIQEYFSARGLMNLRPDDEETEMLLTGLTWPLKAQNEFQLRIKDEAGTMQQRCVVALASDAAMLHVKLKGNVVPIQCEGDGTYRGIKVHVQSSLWFVEQLGVFFNSEDVLKSPLGTFRATIKIVDLKLN